jgi:hypothetical protein
MAIHEGVAVDLPCHVLIVKSAKEPQVPGLRGAATSSRRHVVELQPQRGPADSAIVDGPLAFPAVTRPDLALRLGADATGRRAPGGRAWLGSDAATLAMPGEEKVEPGLEDGLGRGPGMGVGEGIARGVELGQEALRYRYVEPSQLLGERNGQRRRWRSHPKEWFIRMNHDRGVANCRHGCRDWLRNDVAHGRPRYRSNRGRNLGSLAPGEVEEAGNDVDHVVPGRHLGQLDDAREAEAAVPKGSEHLLMALDEFCRDLSVVSSALREPKLAMEKPEQARVTELGPSPLSVEVGQGHEELGHGAALPGKELGQAIGESARSAHAFSVASGPDIARFTLGDSVDLAAWFQELRRRRVIRARLAETRARCRRLGCRPPTARGSR